MECSLEANKARCPCTYPCQRNGKCCECIEYHRKRGELPGCYFSKSCEATWDRSFENYFKDKGR